MPRILIEGAVEQLVVHVLVDELVTVPPYDAAGLGLRLLPEKIRL